MKILAVVFVMMLVSSSMVRCFNQLFLKVLLTLVLFKTLTGPQLRHHSTA